LTLWTPWRWVDKSFARLTEKYGWILNYVKIPGKNIAGMRKLKKKNRPHGNLLGTNEETVAAEVHIHTDYMIKSKEII